MNTVDDAVRCRSAHPTDFTRCEGSPDAVRVVDRTGAEVSGCVHHATVLLARLIGGRVYPGSVPGAAALVYRRAALLIGFAGTAMGGDR